MKKKLISFSAASLLFFSLLGAGSAETNDIQTNGYVGGQVIVESQEIQLNDLQSPADLQSTLNEALGQFDIDWEQIDFNQVTNEDHNAEPTPGEQSQQDNEQQEDAHQEETANEDASNEDASQETDNELTADEQQMLDLVNQERENNGLQPLQSSDELVEVARVKAQDMIDNDYFSHHSPVYGSPFDMLDSFGVEYRTAGENLAGNHSVEAAHQSLMESDGHRENILNSQYGQVGIGVVEGGPYGKMFVQIFTD